MIRRACGYTLEEHSSFKMLPFVGLRQHLAVRLKPYGGENGRSLTKTGNPVKKAILYSDLAEVKMVEIV